MSIKLFLCLLIFLLPLARAEALERYLTGNKANVQPKTAGPANLLGGGGEVDAGIQWLINQVRGCTDCPTKLDVVVLRASGSNEWNDTIYKMNGVDSIESLVIHSPSDANRPDVETTIKNAEVVFFAGGDQCRYVRNIKNTKAETAVKSVYSRGGGVGGSSAGEAIQSDFIYDACTGSVTSKQALSDPYHKEISFTQNFFLWPNLQGTFADQHLVARDRIGRTVTFLARQIQDKKAKQVLAVAVNEDTSALLDKFGVVTVIGAGPVYFILADHPPEVCLPKKPLTFSNYKIWKVNTGQTFDLKNRPTEGYYLRSVIQGAFDANPYQ